MTNSSITLSNLSKQIQNSQHRAQNANHTKRETWQTNLEQLNTLPKTKLRNCQGILTLGNTAQNETLKPHFSAFKPWRKGPFQIGDLLIESEWRCDMKWARLEQHIAPLSGKKVLDVGAGNGYFSFQMALNQAKEVVAVEQVLLFYYQFLSINTLMKPALPIDFYVGRLETLSVEHYFDSVFSMGVLYHQKSPIEHLLLLKKMLSPGGELILETLIVEGALGHHLMPKERYAQMRNVWFIPSLLTLINWLERCGFKEIRTINISDTSNKEQSATEWLGEDAKSLQDFLDPTDNSKTIEGYPAPKRAMLLAKI